MDSKNKIQFYTGFPNYDTLMYYCHKFLGPAVNCLNYWCSSVSDGSEKKPLKEVDVCQQWKFFLMLVRLRLGLCKRPCKSFWYLCLDSVSYYSVV